VLELQQLTQAQQRTTAVAKAAKQSLRDAKAAKPAVLHIQQNEPFVQTQQREAMLKMQYEPG